MKLPIELPPSTRKVLGVALVAVVAYVIVEGTGIGAAPKLFVATMTTRVKTFFQKSFPARKGSV
jgi:hypothetical protein